MNPLLPALFGLIAATSWGIADFFAATASKRHSAESTVLGVSIIGVIAYTIIYTFFPGHSGWSEAGVVYSLAAGIFMGSGLLLFYRGLETGPVSIVSPVGSAYPLVTTLIVLTLFGGSLGAWQIAGILLITTGIIIAGVFEGGRLQVKLSAGIMYALMTFVFWGIAFALLGQAVSAVGWQKTTLVDIWFELISVAAVLPLLGHRRIYSDIRPVITNKFVYGAALIQLLGLIAFDFGLTKVSSSAIITAISASYPALTVILALKHFDEKQTFIPLAGAFLAVVGVVVLSI